MIVLHRPGLGEVIDNPFDSWWWKNRKPLGYGALALAGLMVLSSVKRTLK